MLFVGVVRTHKQVIEKRRLAVSSNNLEREKRHLVSGLEESKILSLVQCCAGLVY